MKAAPLAAALALTSQFCPASDWLQFRGPLSSGNAPTTAGTGNLALSWKAPLPGRGLSSPLIAGNRVFLTASSGPKQETLHVLCFDATTGNSLWDRSFRATGRTMCHEKTCNAAPTPCSDGSRIFALFSSNDLLCLDLDGNLIWLRGLMVDFPNAANSLGLASSPVIAGNSLITQIENDSESFTAGISRETGTTLWTRPGPKDANWTSPAVQRDTDGSETLVIASRDGAAALDPDTGRERWKLPGPGSSIPSITVSGPWLAQPRPGKGHALWKLSSGTTPPQLAWESPQVPADTASPVIHGNNLFSVSSAGVLTCASLDDGSRPWKLRLDGKFSGSPVMAGPILFIGSELGTLIAADTSAPEGRITARLDLGEPILCTPSLANQAVFVRSDKSLWKIECR